MIKGKDTRIAGGAKFWSENTMMVGGLTSKPTITNQHNFVSNPTLPAFLTLNRLSAATRFDSTGTLVDAAADVPRFDYGYDGTNWINQGLLVEKQSTNSARVYLASNSEWVSSDATNTPKTVSSDTVGGISSYATITNNFRQSAADRLISPAFLRTVIDDVFTGSVYMSLGTANVLGIGMDGMGVGGLMAGFNSNGEMVSYDSRLSKSTFKSFDKLKKLTATLKNSWGNRDASMWFCYGSSPKALGLTFNAHAAQLEMLPYSTSLIKTNGNSVTRSQDNLQLNLSNYTGSIKLTYKRQDTEVVESTWLDLTNATNPIISSSLSVGIWLQNIRVYNRILTTQEKANA